MTELARGAVSDRPWGRTLGALGLRGLTGQLTLAADGKRFQVAFSGGAVVGAASPIASDAAVRVALTGGLISSTQVAEVARRQAAAPERDEIELLSELLRIGPDQSMRLRRRTIAQRAARTFSIDRGEFVVEDEQSLAVVAGSEIDVRSVIYLGARQNLSEARLAGELAMIGAWFRLQPSALEDLPQYGFTEADRPVLERLQDGATLEELDESGVEPRIARAMVYALVSCNACEIGGAGRAFEAAAKKPGSAPDVPVRASGTLPLRRAPPLSAPRSSSGIATPPPARSGSSPGIATPPPASRSGSSPGIATPPPGRSSGSSPGITPPGRATGGAPGIAPPGRSSGSSPGIAPPRSGSSPPTGVVSSRAGTAAGSGATRQPPASAPIAPAPATSTGPTPAAEPGTSAAAGPTAPRRASTSPGTSPGANGERRGVRVAARRADPAHAEEVRAVIQQRLGLLERGVDHFQLLGVSIDAPLEEVRQAYFALARQLHPDRLSALGIDDSPRDAQRLFAHVNTAFAILSDRARRDEYTAVLRRGGEAVVRAEQAQAEAIAKRVLEGEDAYQRGDAALRAGQLPQAIAELSRAVELAPDEADYRASLAWAQFCAAHDKQLVGPQTRATLEQAIAASPKAVTPRFLLGRVERMLGRDADALRHFQEVVRRAPSHHEAASELRLLEQRLAQRRR